MKQTPPALLKLNWERGMPPAQLSQQEIEKAVADYTSQKVASFEFLSQGCANSNYKITFEHGTIVVLRAYTRDPGSLLREYHLHQLIQDKVPVPRFFHINGDTQLLPYPFAIMEYAEGCLFRSLILEGRKDAIASCAFQAGKILVQAASFQFKEGFFFEDDLSIKPFGKDETFFNFISSFLSNSIVNKGLGGDLSKQLHILIDKYQGLIDEIAHHHHLSHADYDPSNILVKRENGEWKISAILDWEFAYSGTYYMDVGLMLRYAHKLPPFFQNSFIQGIQDANPSLLDHNWEVRAKLMDILSLLSLYAAPSSQNRPLMCEDIRGLLQHTCQCI